VQYAKISSMPQFLLLGKQFVGQAEGARRKISQHIFYQHFAPCAVRDRSRMSRFALRFAWF
jgi:hypothetical protein